MRLARLFLFFVCGVLVFHSNATLARRITASHSAAQKPSAIIVVTPQQKPATLADFAWLAGRWEGKLPFPGSDKPLTAEQQWFAPSNGAILGMFRLNSDQKTVIIELFTLRETPDGIFFYFRHFSPELVPQEKDNAYRLKLAKWDASRFQFDNTVQNNLKDAILTVVDSDHYISHGDITGSDGKPAVIEVAYHRVK
ncbi:MAG TPA: DUF6265 family protein [Candidatus Acidoferrum sp.]|nr:DUF6265 family protein [Candidatus Acidoferrum sp.]